MKKYLFLLAALPLVLVACRHFLGRRIHGNGNIKTEEHTVSSFRELHVSSNLDVYVSHGDLRPIRFEGDENLLSYIEIDQEGDRITIKNRDNVNLETDHDLKIYITAPDFRKISVSGAGNIIGENKISSSEVLELGLSGAGDIRMEVDAPKVVADISGVGSVYLKGQSKDADLRISGAGSAHCYDLLSENATVQISGVGSAEVYASVKLDASASGVGSIHYKGNPATINKQVSGVGSVDRAD